MLRRALEVVSQRIFVAVQRDSDLTTVDQRAKQQFVRQRFFQVVLNDASHWTCPHRPIVAFRRQPVARFLTHFQGDAFLVQLDLQLDDKLVDNLMDHRGRQMIEPDDVVEAVTELRRKDLFDLIHRIRTVVLLNKANRFTLGFPHPGVGGHHQHHVAEVRFTAVIIGQRPVIHHLQQQVEHVRMRFFDLIKQQYRVRMFNHRIGQQPALIEADVARRRPDQTADGMTFHIFGHVKAQQLNP